MVGLSFVMGAKFSGAKIHPNTSLTDTLSTSFQNAKMTLEQYHPKFYSNKFPNAFNYHEEYHALTSQTATLSKTSKEQHLVQSSNLLGTGSYIKAASS